MVPAELRDLIPELEQLIGLGGEALWDRVDRTPASPSLTKIAEEMKEGG